MNEIAKLSLPPEAAKEPSPPRDLSREARKWWCSVSSSYILEDSHYKMLDLAARTLDRKTTARRALRSGLTYTDKAGIRRPKPEIIIERQSAILFARLLRELRILNVEDDDDERIPRNRSYEATEEIEMKKIGHPKRRNELTAEMKSFFLTGLDLGIFDFPAGSSVAHRLWTDNYALLMTEWLNDPEHWGRRPPGWWEYSRPMTKTRRQLAGPPPLESSPLYYGYPSHWPVKNLLFEPECEFLHRNGLLTGAERERYSELKAKARAELKSEALRRGEPRPAGMIATPTMTYTPAELDSIFQLCDACESASEE